jgi:hypothetical protein
MAAINSSIDLAYLPQDLAAGLIPRPVVPNATSRSKSPPHIVVSRDAALMESFVRNRMKTPCGLRRLVPRSGWCGGGSAASPRRRSRPDLDPAELPELTEPYRRGSKGGSAGLGFAIVAEAARRLKVSSRRRARTRRTGDLLAHLPALDWLMTTYKWQTP